MAERLAIHGGPKAITQPGPHYAWPDITDGMRAAVLRQLDESISIYDRSGIIEKLESRLARFHRRKHALLTSSGTAALHSLYVGLSLKEGDEVICPAYTFFATATPLFFTGATPVLADAGPDGNIDPEAVEGQIGPRTKAIMATHMWGVPCNMDALGDIAARHGLLLLEDASHAFGAIYHGKPAGSLSHAAAISLQGQKTLTGGEGGVVLTDDDEVFYRALMLGHYNKRCRSEIPETHPLHIYATTGMGLKLRIHPLAAALADAHLDHMHDLLAGRRRIAAMMSAGLAGIPGLTLPIVPPNVEPSWYAFVMQYAKCEVSLTQFHEAALAEGCLELDRPSSTRPLHMHPLFTQPSALFHRFPAPKSGAFPVAERFHRHSLKLPVWHADEDMALRYIAAIKKVATGAP